MWKNVTPTTCQWQAAVRIPNPVNSDRAGWFPRPAVDDWLYFGSNRIGGHGKNAIWRARESTPERWVVENLGPNRGERMPDERSCPSFATFASE